MSLMRILILVVAGGAALVAAMLVRGMGQQEAPQIVEVVETVAPQPQIQLSQILVAREDMPLGHRMSPNDLTWQDWPEELLNDNYFVADFAPEAMTELAGSVVRTPIYTGEPIIASKIVQAGDNGFLAAVLNEGMRAVAVEISVETAAGGFILPNDHVDVILTYDVEVNEGDVLVERAATQTILQNVRVLAIDQTYREFEGESVVVGTTATLELAPQHAEVLMLGTRMGDISLTLRGISELRNGGEGVLASGDFRSPQAGIGSTVRVYRNGNAEQANIGGSR